jgi:membrane-associated protein
MEFFHELYTTLRHLNPESVNHFAHYVGPWLYIVFFAIIFCETGLVVMPFLPGDSLLFVLGAVAASGDAVSLKLLCPLLCLAANCGDLLNYSLGYHIGPKVFSRENSRLLNKKHLLEAQKFYDKHGRKTIIMARFVPIIRTFAPFVAGVGKMPFVRFALFSVTGGMLWVVSLTLCGYFFGTIPFVQKHFELIVVAIVLISVLPVVIHFFQARREARKSDSAGTRR